MRPSIPGGAGLLRGRGVVMAAGFAGLAVGQRLDGDGLLAWAERTGHHAVAGQRRGGLRFAFYGRMSTEDYQDPVTSRARQVGQAGGLVAEYGGMGAGDLEGG